jgi:hypothetical protein
MPFTNVSAPPHADVVARSPEDATEMTEDPQDDGLISLIADAITADAANANRLTDVRIAGLRRGADADVLWAVW